MSYEVITTNPRSDSKVRGGLPREKELQQRPSAPISGNQFVPGGASSLHLAKMRGTEPKPKPFQAEGKSLLSLSSTPTEPCSTL